MKKNISTIKRFLLWTGGYDQETVSQCSSSEINRMAIFGTMILIPAFVGMFSFGYAFYLIFRNQLIAFIAGPIWSVIILFIDRAIVGYSRSRFNLGTLGRVFLGVVIGLFVSEPVLLAFFSGAIKRQEFQNEVLKEKEINKVYNGKTATLEESLYKLREYTRKAQVNYQKELNGTGGSKEKGPGVIYKRLLLDYQKDSAYLASQEKTVKEKIAGFNKERAVVTNAMKVNQNETKGLLTKIIALNKLTYQNENHEVFIVVWATRIFFLLIELIPILMKITPTGYKGVYHEIIDQNDRELLDLLKFSSNTRVAKLQKEDDLKNTIEMLNLNSSLIEAKVNSAERNAYFLMDELTTVMKKHNSFRQLVVKQMEEAGMQEKVFSELDAISATLIKKIGLSLAEISKV